MGFIDLHVHSTASDGSKTPSELVHDSLELGLKAIALTDHDTIDGIEEALNAAADTPLLVIPGVEISTTYKGHEYHVLGYNIDYKNDFLVDILDKVAYLRYERNASMCELLQKHGLDITIEELYSENNSKTITRGNMGRLLIKKGFVSSMKEAFEKYIGNDGPCYVPRFKMQLSDAYKLINYAGGVCSLAHPVQYKLSYQGYRNLFIALKSIGFTCVEAIHSDNKASDEEQFKKLAEETGLLITGGSDYHGASKPDIFLGTGRGNLMIPQSLLANIVTKHR